MGDPIHIVELIDQILEEKSKLAEQITGVGEEWISEMSNVQLEDFLKLRKEAVAE